METRHVLSRCVTWGGIPHVDHGSYPRWAWFHPIPICARITAQVRARESRQGGMKSWRYPSWKPAVQLADNANPQLLVRAHESR